MLISEPSFGGRTVRQSFVSVVLEGRTRPPDAAAARRLATGAGSNHLKRRGLAAAGERGSRKSALQERGMVRPRALPPLLAAGGNGSAPLGGAKTAICPVPRQAKAPFELVDLHRQNHRVGGTAFKHLYPNSIRCWLNDLW